MSVPVVNGPLSYADRWMRDALLVLRPPYSVYFVAVDMTEALRKLDQARLDGIQATTTHLLVRAAACALAAHPHLHQVVGGNQRRLPTRVDIGLAVSGDGILAPILVLQAPDRMALNELVSSVARGVPEARMKQERLKQFLNTWGRLIPFGILRRAILRRVYANPAARIRACGTFQVSTVPVDRAVTGCFMAPAVLVAGQVRSQIVAVDGEAVARPMMELALSSDHSVWDGRASAQVLAAIKADLEAPSEH
jgi:pyruvate/2-oxoglutarate dehydrogenase complex dihydrolipoamide acyltransferase (E2) component